MLFASVTNKILKLTKLSQPEEWRHAPGRDNPGDLASRVMQSKDGAKGVWRSEPRFVYLAVTIFYWNKVLRSVRRWFICRRYIDMMCGGLSGIVLLVELTT